MYHFPGSRRKKKSFIYSIENVAIPLVIFFESSIIGKWIWKNGVLMSGFEIYHVNTDPFCCSLSSQNRYVFLNSRSLKEGEKNLYDPEDPLGMGEEMMQESKPTKSHLKRKLAKTVFVFFRKKENFRHGKCWGGGAVIFVLRTKWKNAHSS